MHSSREPFERRERHRVQNKRVCIVIVPRLEGRTGTETMDLPARQSGVDMRNEVQFDKAGQGRAGKNAARTPGLC